jgi:uracil phosphoribosyltransferase
MQSDLFPQVYLLASNPQLKALMTILRDKNTSRSDFIFYADRITRLVVEEGGSLQVIYH